VLVSIVLHVVVMLGTSGHGLVAGHGASFGDGFGGQSVEIEIAGPHDGPAHGARAPSAVQDVQPSAQEPAEDASLEEPTEPIEPLDPAEEAALRGELAVNLPDAPVEAPVERPPPRVQPVTPGPEPTQGVSPLPGQADTASIDDPEATAEASPSDAPTPSGTGAEATTAGAPAGDVAGLILGSAGISGADVSARQALLPNSGVCSDPVAGVWRAQKYRTSDHTWVRFVLRVRREGGGLGGTITSRIWTGTRSDPRPGDCTAFGMDHTWRMRARGSVAGDQLTFNSVGGARLIAQDCPRSDSRYAPDRFSGRVHPLREVFESTNNDGAFDIDEPYTFRRVSCE